MIDIEMVEKMNDRIAILEDTVKVLNEVVSSLAQSLNGLQNAYIALSTYVATIPNTEVLEEYIATHPEGWNKKEKENENNGNNI